MQIQGHFSRFARPGSAIVPTAGFTALSSAEYEAVRNRTVVCRASACPPAQGFPLLSTAWADADMATAGVVVANVNANDVQFSLVDTAGGRFTDCAIPAHSIQTYSFSTD